MLDRPKELWDMSNSESFPDLQLLLDYVVLQNMNSMYILIVKDGRSWFNMNSEIYS